MSTQTIYDTLVEIDNKTATASNQASTNTKLDTIHSDLATGIATTADKNVVGTISALNGTVTVNTNGCSTVFFSVSGTFVASLQFEGDPGDGVWQNVAAINQNNGIFYFITVPGVTFIAPVGGFKQFRLRAVTYTSGTVNLTLNAGSGVNVVEVFQPVAAAFQVTANAGTNLNTSALALDTSVSALQVSQGSTTSGQKGQLIQGAATTNQPSYTTAQTSPLSLTLRGGVRAKVIGLDPVALVRNDYSTTNVTTSAYVQLVASTSLEINRLSIFDSSGQDFVLATGGAGSEVDQIQIPPGGWDAPIELYVPSGTRISIKAKSATASSGILLITGLK